MSNKKQKAFGEIVLTSIKEKQQGLKTVIHATGKADLDKLEQELTKNGLKVLTIHGEGNQIQLDDDNEEIKDELNAPMLHKEFKKNIIPELSQ